MYIWCIDYDTMRVFHLIFNFFDDSSGRASPSETKSEKSSVTQMTSFSGGTGGSTLGAKLSHDQGQRNVRCPDSFVSIQLEKVSWICHRIMVMLGFHYKDSCHDWNLALRHGLDMWSYNILSDLEVSHGNRVDHRKIFHQLKNFLQSTGLFFNHFNHIRSYKGVTGMIKFY